MVTAVGWTAPTFLLSMSGDRPVYSSRAARFFPGVLPDTVLAAGGITGDGCRDQLVEHAGAIGREAARRAARIRRDWISALPGRAPGITGDGPAGAGQPAAGQPAAGQPAAGHAGRDPRAAGR